MEDDRSSFELLIFQFLKEDVLPSLKDGDHDAVLRKALLAYLLCQENQDGTKFDALVLIEAAVKDLKNKFLKQEEWSGSLHVEQCSFCGQKPPRVRLGAGPNAFICNECVETLHTVFQAKTST